VCVIFIFRETQSIAGQFVNVELDLVAVPMSQSEFSLGLIEG
jgi:hypothetical protein